MIVFEWDEQKATANLRKHGVSFEEAKTAFSDEHARLIVDPDHSADEDRFVLLGYGHGQTLLVVCHCHRASDRIIRIISARCATRREATFY
ncbi:BrnT family toxin [Methyloversatilis sp.]|uniref:BrnT family toxin n=1 Tax=Methyloversatilis sp. TaxID=2569862 RepID=UPI0027331ECD|nr:BrnT family toxin [Methyloversatilis sp.]MDP2867326.1 BrnT family toxin [Methyloversatilis sp.]MDP3290221.1 BrnT family toxin [Methyloversatilis sp.]MDP3456950.1 BrnT family toxin [Methyloversatilis sp.]MDP3579912.1 BrnT family toxin [Methyloversatilis sp.]